MENKKRDFKLYFRELWNGLGQIFANILFLFGFAFLFCIGFIICYIIGLPISFTMILLKIQPFYLHNWFYKKYLNEEE